MELSHVLFLLIKFNIALRQVAVSLLGSDSASEKSDSSPKKEKKTSPSLYHYVIIIMYESGFGDTTTPLLI